ncbi:MAG: PaaI family thioesterase [Eubacteriales bacterium]|nr:PaaI family thioesterase [Eubacteriales bacterium]MDD3199864.1 PaaI family thioesterase [Eubacteriales bacterium]MDD4121325.1 PaaI family thioesterase [Eubacteriales bacterium]MDD4630104.1 PaaI family thioesterase [Eubacteriales bacterium]
MKQLNELLKQEKLEEGMRRILVIINNEKGHTNQLMEPRLVSCSEKEQTVTLEFPVLEWQLNSNSVMHGGIVSTAFDIAMGILANYLHISVTGNMAINFTKPIPIGDSLIITSKVTSFGKRLITLSAEGRLKSSGLIAGSAIATYAAVRS